MALNSDIGDGMVDKKQGESGSYSYILRIWEIAPGRFKGYLLDPITNKTYPLVSFLPSEFSPLSSGVFIKPGGFWLGVWDDESAG